jgi:hypothetical protein
LFVLTQWTIFEKVTPSLLFFPALSLFPLLCLFFLVGHRL